MYFSKTPGIQGSLKTVPEDFLVEEIDGDGTIIPLFNSFSRSDEEGRFVHFVLQKKNWSTPSAMAEVASRLRINQKRMSAAGMKDKVAITSQLCSAEGCKKEDVLNLKIKDIQINGAWTAKDKIRLGSNLGNRFNIFVRDAEPEPDEKIAAISDELGGKFPNYFGSQRFGSSRKNTHLVGLKILERNFEDAVMLYLCDSSGEQNAEAIAARKELEASRAFSSALKSFPEYLKLERSMIASLAKNPDNYILALKKLPRNILLLFIHAVQSDIFNQLLSERIGEEDIELEEGEYFCGETLGFPDIEKAEGEGWICAKLIGFGSRLNQREKALFEKLGIEKDAFRMNELPEIASRGAYRTIFAPLRDFSYKQRFIFSLPAGSYATVAMDEFMKKG